MSNEDLAATVARLSAIEEITRLIQAYREFVDQRDLKSFSELFTADGEWMGGSGSATSPAGIQAMLETNLAPNPAPPGATTYHRVTNLVIDVEGDRATGFCNWELVSRSADDTPVSLRVGHYEDVYRREDGAWKFRRRLAHLDIPHKPLPEHAPSAEIR